MKFVCLFCVCTAVAFAQDPGVERDALVGFESINKEDLRTYITYLASDSLKGRETSYEGARLAAKYIADHFRSFGLIPEGDDGTYAQHYGVELIGVSDSSSMTVHAEGATSSFAWMKGFLAFGARDTGVSGRVAIVGFADNRTPEADRSKLAGRVAVMFAGSRTGVMPPTPSRRGLFRGARRDSGVVATLIVLDDTGAFSYDRMISQLSASGLVRGRMTLKGEVPRQTRTTPLFFFVSPKAAKAILASTGISLAQAREYAARDSIFAPMLLDDVTVDVRTKTTREDRQAENVVGLLEGSDPGLKKEVVVFSAHFDHLGVDPSGAIYHGADDNGSGTAMVIELARAFSKNPVRPKCSLLFLCVSGEEKGLLGSSYYTSHPVIPLDRTVADFNTDMIGRMDSTHEREHSGVYTYLIGSDKISTELDSILRVANKESDNIGLDYKYDDEHDLNEFYRRSDHYNFARRGVPIAFFFTGVHADYHRPTDTVDKILFDRIVKIGQVVYYAGWKTANITHMLVKNGTRNGYRDSPQIPGAE